MPDTGPHPVGQVNCPSCGRLVYINQDGRLRHHHADGSKTACPASRQPAPGGSVLVRKLRDGVVIKVRHAAGTFDQAARQRWAALSLYLKAVCEAIDNDLVTAETAFLPYVVMPDGLTLGEKIAPQIEAAYSSGTMPALMAGNG